MSVRLISRLDVKMSHLIKGVQMEGWRKMGDPAARARKYYADGADELLYIDVVASLYERNNLADILREVASDTFVPITVGGGIDSLSSAKALLDVGADKVAVNTAATKRPEMLNEISDTYGSQAMVLSVEAKRLSGGGWTAMTDNGRNHTGRDAIEWIKEAADRGVGEILITSIDQDGGCRGMDLDLVSAATEAVNVPVIASGGAANLDHVQAAISKGVSGVAIAKAIHSDALNLIELRQGLVNAGIPTRPYSMQEMPGG
jgi:cyclase